MPSVERAAQIVADPDVLRQVLLAVERWPIWASFARKVTPAALDGGPEGDWSIVALLGKMPFSGFARLSVTDGSVSLATLTSAAPVEFARYAFTLPAPDDPRVTLRVDYEFSRTPGGWVIDRTIVRRNIAAQLDAALDGLRRVTG
jgi:hypothetical protein